MAMNDRKPDMNIPRNDGFTLVELMITVLLASLIMAAVYTAYLSMQRSYLAQEQVSEMQQTLRAAVDMMVREIRMAGYNPAGSANAGIVTATAGQLQIRKDITNTAGTSEDGDGALDGPNEDVTFGFAPADDAGGDGMADAGVATFSKQPFAAGFQDMAENIVAVEFNYFIEGNNGSLSSTTSPSAGQVDKVRSIQISMLARSDRADPRFTGGQQFVTGSGATWGPYPDNFRRRLMVTTVQCRNLGL